MLHGDFETLSILDLTKVGGDNYSRHPSTDALCFAFAMDDGPIDLLEPGDYEFAPFLDYIANGGKFIAHNVPFELAIWNNVMRRRYGWPELKPEQCFCTMAMAYAMSLPGALEHAAPAAGIDHRKDMDGHRVMLQLSQPREYDEKTGKVSWWTREEFPEKYEKLFSYCRQDIAVERELAKRLVPISEAERAVWLLDQRINNRGIQIDVPSVGKALDLVTTEKARLNERMREVSNNAIATCTAVAQITSFLNVRGGYAPHGIAKEAAKDILERTDLPKDCREVLILRQEAGKSSTAKFATMLNQAGADGRLRGMFQYHGASTGRWAGRAVNLQNLPRSKIPQSTIDGVFEIIEVDYMPGRPDQVIFR